MFCDLCNIKHIEICPFTYKRICPFGCNCIGFSEEQLQEHRREKYLFHSDILYSSLREWGFNKDFDGNNTNLSVIENKIVTKLELELKEIKALINKATYMKKKLILKKKERKEQMKLLEKAIVDSSLTSFNGKLVWIIPEALRELLVIHSPVFYTGKYGYKLRLAIKKERDRSSVCLIFLKGIYDAVLTETFPTKLMIKYQIDQREKKTLDPIQITLSRIKTDDKSMEKEILIKHIESGPLVMIRFELDCSELDLPSTD